MKRIFDLIVSIIVLILLSPIYLLIPILIKIESKGPVFFRQNRVGINKKTIVVFKYRSMKVDKQAEENFEFHKDAIRVTKVGKFIRRTKIDELPQIFNVLKGDMSIVGPRPTIRSQVEEYTDRQKKRLSIRPGLTGLAQVNGNINLNWDERIEYDLEYIEHQSFWLDLKIIFKTVGVVLFGEDKFTKKRVE